jgi:hypothetical protein
VLRGGALCAVSRCVRCLCVVCCVYVLMWVMCPCVGVASQMCEGAFGPGEVMPNRLSPDDKPFYTVLLPVFSGLQAHHGPRISRNKIRLSSEGSHAQILPVLDSQWRFRTQPSSLSLGSQTHSAFRLNWYGLVI